MPLGQGQATLAGAASSGAMAGQHPLRPEAEEAAQRTRRVPWLLTATPVCGPLMTRGHVDMQGIQAAPFHVPASHCHCNARFCPIIVAMQKGLVYAFLAHGQ